MKKSFTLVELLIVMTIICLLLGMILPVLNRVRDNAKRAKARDQAIQIASAWQGYLQEYRVLPADNGKGQPITEMETNVLNVLSKKGDTYNRLGVEFMEFTTNEYKTGFLDPWGTLYQVRLDNDGNYDGKVTVPHEATDLDRSAAVWSKGKDMRDSTAKERADDLKSWK